MEYKVKVNEDIQKKIDLITKLGEVDIEEVLGNIINENAESLLANEIIKLYKEGKLKAREAWKATGLDYQEFQNRANQ